MIQRIIMLTIGLAVLAGSGAARGEDIQILPGAIRLVGPGAGARFLVEAWDGQAFVADRTAEARFSIDDPRVARVGPDGFVHPVGNGLAVLSATVGAHTARASISVEEFDRPPSWSFRNHVEAVLTRHGCNSGACHGAAAGKNGLRLSLRGYAPEQDCDVLTRQALGRRIVPAAPAESLLLLKPSGTVPHGGGVRFAPGSQDYRVLAEWIAAGMPPPSASDPALRSLEVYPRGARLAPGQIQQVLVRATYSDGQTSDVTHWARFASTDESVARVDGAGRVTVAGRGEAAITVGFGTAVDRVTVTVPMATTPDPRIFASAPRVNRIDELNLTKLASLGIPPSPDAGDRAFLRRAYLDATGTLPPVKAIEAFLNDRDPQKRARLIDRLLTSPEFVDYWTYRWSDLFLVSSTKLAPQAVWAFHRFLRQSVGENIPWDRFARALLTSRGSNLASGGANFFILHRDPIDLAESTSMAFLGLSITCARCHNHPMEKWTQDQYYGFTSLFARVQLKDGTAPGEVIVASAGDGEVTHPRRGVPMPPAPLDAPAMGPEDRTDRREVLARWLTGPDNPYFARAIVNRVWSNVFGRGLIHPEDDLRTTNPPADEALLDWLVADFVAHGHDVKHLIRTIMNSAVYARSSVPVPGNEPDTKFLSHYPLKRLPAEVLLDTVSQVTEVPTSFSGYPAGWRSLQLPDSKVDNVFLDAFGRPVRVNTCSCERSSEPSMGQALHLANGATLNDKLRSNAGVIARALAAGQSDQAVLDRLFLSALCRQPTSAETERLKRLLESPTPASADPKARALARRQAIEDLYWAILTTKEFLFNH
jgi:hypothetical protein